MTTPVFRRTAAVPPGLPVPVAPGPRNVYLHPGQLFASDEPTVVTTVLGSCVSVCLWDRTSQVGGINHYVLPHLLPSDLSSPRFADFAMRDLVRRLLDFGVRRGSLEAKVFGGAGLSQMSARPGRRHLGEQNVSRALAVLEEERIPVVASDTGGSRGRKLMFRTDDGTVWLKAL
jgi:chemotaxis protein CheD